MYTIEVFDGNGNVILTFMKDSPGSPWFCWIDNQPIVVEFIPVLWRYLPAWKKIKSICFPAVKPLTIRVYSYGSYVFGVSDITYQETLESLSMMIDNVEKYIKQMTE